MQMTTGLMTTGSSPFTTMPAAEAILTGTFRADPDRFSANEEPRLDDLLEDPIVTRLMASDGLHRDLVCAVVRDVRAQLDGGR